MMRKDDNFKCPSYNKLLKYNVKKRQTNHL